MTGIDTRGLSPSAIKALQAVAHWLASVTGDRRRQGRFELVAGEGRVKALRETAVYRPEDVPDA